MTLAVLIPAANEAGRIGPCLDAVLASTGIPAGARIVVAANGCTDGTVDEARDRAGRAAASGWRLEVLDLPGLGKPGALNAAEEALGPHGGPRVYLDADVTVSAELMSQLAAALDRPGPAYASGRLRMTARGPAARAYAATWARVPFMAEGVPGCGLYAVNAAGRARWGRFPDIIADDAFVRLNFAEHERIGVRASYDWPVVEGAAALLRVRRRQDAGVREVAARFPGLMANETGRRARAAPLAARAPLSFAFYAGIGLLSRVLPHRSTWSRGR
ncbi:glycosyltransferase family 2 protein [Wenxinia saemankumensis]|uniref:Glycosyltransferase involved in cell wall bisynthesis n=1 Tax=Wenxinia saemankumensis TaxID=1447782 RepID=A0A1M6FZU3_9RHOB|nr:glycosyltransferase family A protein [Wenxinia saemankumensis]SHJ03174.1 Glycosyltransferase involved in cell wall bisynthesis [Wenxinia saemankumensis]